MAVPNQLPTHSTNSSGWVTFSYAQFGAAAFMAALGIWAMPVELIIKGYLMMSSVFLVGATFTLAKTVRDRDGQLCIEIKTPQDLQREVDLDQGNIFHNALSWFFTDDPAQVGSWGVETKYPRIYRAGSSALRGGAVSGIPGRNAAMCALQDVGIAPSL